MAKVYHPNMHTAEHILNHVITTKFNIDRSFSNHLERKKSKCDFRFDRDLTEEEINSIEFQVNDLIKKNLPVTEFFLPFEEANNRYNLSKLPEEFGDEIRIIKVGEVDECPCIGEHVSSTGEIGNFKIISTGYNDGVLRIRFKLPKES